MPVNTHHRSRIGSSPIRFSSKSLELLALLALCSLGPVLRAQTIEIKLVNGKSGRPLGNTCMYVWVGDKSNPNSGPLLETQTDNNGSVILRLDREHSEINNQSQMLVCGLRGVINPTVKYGDTISVRAGYVLCQPDIPDYSWLASTDFSTKEVLQRGIVTANTCGKATAPLKFREVVLFVRPLSWWEKLK
jgi:hypothetical protein